MRNPGIKAVFIIVHDDLYPHIYYSMESEL